MTLLLDGTMGRQHALRFREGQLLLDGTMGPMGRMGPMIMGLWDERTNLWGTMGLWDGNPCHVELPPAPRPLHPGC